MRRAREVARSLRGFERLGAAVGLSSLALVALEGASLTLLVPVLQSFRPGAESRLRLLILGVGSLFLLRAVASYANGVLSARLQVRLLLSLRESLAAALYRARYAEVAALGPGRLVNLFSVQTERVVAGVYGLVMLLNAGLLVAVYGAMLVVLSWRLTLGAALLGASGFAVTAYAGRRIRERSVGIVRAEEDSSRLVADDAAGLHVIRAYDVGRERLALHRQANQRLDRELMGFHRWRSAVRPAVDVLYAAALLGALWATLAFRPQWILANGPLIVAVAFVLFRLQGQFAALSDGATILAEQEGAALNVFGFVSRAGPGPHTDGEPLPASVGRVTVEGVRFRYPEGGPVLDGLDLDLRRGEVTAVVGRSGAGKSTLVQLLAGLRSPGTGRISLDRIPLDRAARAALARQVGVVFEDCYVFDESLMWNITLGRDHRPRDLREAAGAARLDEVVRSLPEGLSTRAGPRGGSLSAGQRQRLALARALVTRPQILILDEATNALDGGTERAVAEGIRALRPEGITLLVAHRLSTVLAADRILVLDGGRIVADGRHEELLDTSPAYRHLVETQLIPANAAIGARPGD